MAVTRSVEAGRIGEGRLRVEVARSFGSLPDEVIRFVDATSRNPFMRIAWLTCWYAVYHPAGWTEHVVVLRRGVDLVAVAPLVVHRIGPVRFFRFAGHGLGNYLDIIASEEDRAPAISALLRHVAAARPSVLEWHDLNSESPSAHLVPGRCARLYSNPRAIFGDDWDTHFRATVADRKDRRRLTRKCELLEQHGQVTHVPEVLAADEKLFAEIRDLHRRRFAGTPNPLLQDRFWTFLGRLARMSLGRDLVISLLRLDERLISVLVGMRADRTFVSYMLAFEPSLARYSPGHVHVLRQQQYFINAGWHALDFSKGDDSYKRRWSNGATANWDHILGYGLLGRPVAALLRVRSRLVAWAREKGLTRKLRRMRSRRVRLG